MSGGTIVLVQASTGSTAQYDYRVSATSPTITAGTLQVGKSTTAINFAFRIQGQTPNLVIDNTTNNKTVLLTGGTTVNLNATINSGTTLDLGGTQLASTAQSPTTELSSKPNLSITRRLRFFTSQMRPASPISTMVWMSVPPAISAAQRWR